MTVYAARSRQPEVSYFADIIVPSGAATWAHIRTNLGRKIAYAMVAKHYDGFGKIVSFRDGDSARPDDLMWSTDHDGKLRDNIWCGYSTINERV